ncbi:MAG: helix-turn-helix domain-containing protein [Chloroflexi bacterium]|nr:helix-turn-helix domain-containing protein [Chloroflexota bacterium]
MKYSKLGALIKTEREKRGWEQAELAVRLSRRQQTISRWEFGNSRPQREDLLRLIDLFSVDKDIWFSIAGYELNEPDESLAPYLPIQNLSPEKFELFCKAVIQALNPDADVHRYGTRGYKQDGIDIYSKSPKEILDYQCKRHKQFGPADIEEAVNKTTFKAKHHHILLSRNASPESRKKIIDYPEWSLWDREDISEKVRNLTDKDVALRIVDSYFPGKRKSFLGIDEPSPWLLPQDFFLPLEGRSKLFGHGWTIVGRQKELESLKEFEGQKESQALLISGRGGIGKSRLLKAWAEGLNKATNVRFVSPSSNIEAKDIDLLPNGPSFLIIDDAHERSDILVILNGAARTRPEMKLVLSSRPYGITKLEDELMRSGIAYDHEKIVKVDDLSITDAEELAKEILGDPTVDGDKRLAKKIAEITRDCPLATVIGSRLVGQGLIRPELLNNEKKFRDKLLSSFRDVIAGELGGRNPEKIRELLNFLSTVQPFNPSDQKFQKSAEEVLKEHFDVILRNIGVLEDAGVLLRRGYQLRIVPDLLADYIRFEISYDEKNNCPTGYVDRVYKHLQEDLAVHLLTNISQLDWRLSAANVQAMLLESIWKQIFSEVKSANNADRTFILKKIKDVAYFQPEQFMKLVRYLKDNPSTKPERKEFAGLYKYEHKDVLNELPEILGRICYHMEHLPECVDLIWEIGRGDSRRTNPHPGHGIRILQDLAQYDIYELTGKGVKVNELMLEAAKRWLKDAKLQDYSHSPLDIIDKLLDKVSSTDTYKHGKIIFHSFGVHYENTGHIRNEALRLVVETAKSPILTVSLRALESISHALSEPMALFGRKITEEESSKWKEFQMSVLDGIEEITTTQKHPIVSVELKDILAWHAQHSPSPKLKKRARKLFESLSESFEVRLVQAVDQNRDRDWLIDEEKYDYQKIMEKSLKFRQDMVVEFVKKYPNHKEGFTKLDSLLEELEQCGKNPFPITFCAEMAKLYPEYTIGVCEEIIKKPSSILARSFDYFLFGLIEVNQQKTANLLSEAINIDEEKLQVSIADYYWRAKWVNYLDETTDLPNIRKLLKSKYKWAKKLTIGSLGRLGKVRPEIVKELLLSIDLGADKDLADEYFGQFDEKHDFNPDLLLDEELTVVIQKLEKVNSIDDYNIEEFLNYAGKRLPLAVITLLLKRIELSKVKKTGEKYQPLSYSSHTLLSGFSNTKQYADVLREVRNKILEKEWQNRFWIPKLFKSISNNFDEVGVAVLLEWVNSGEKEKVEGVGIIIEDAPENFIFQHTDFVSKMLASARPYGQDFLKLTRNALAHSAIFRSKHGTPGQPMPEDVELKENSEKMLSTFAVSTPEYELFESLVKHANWEIKDQLKRDEELLGEG